MFYLLWLILNSVLILLFIIVCFRSIKLIRVKLGIGAAILFAFGLISFMSFKKDKKDQVKNDWTYPSSVQNEQAKTHRQTNYIELDRNIMCSIGLRIFFDADDKSGKLFPSRAFTTILGTKGSYEWHQEYVNLSQVNDNIYEYSVSGTMTFYLFAFPLINRHKSFEGVIKTISE